MTPERLRELREHIESMSWTHAHDIEHANAALALIDAELAKPLESEVCVWKHVKGSRDTYETCRSVFSGSPEVICDDCGKRVQQEMTNG